MVLKDRVRDLLYRLRSINNFSKTKDIKQDYIEQTGTCVHLS